MKAGEHKSGDVLAGVAASSDIERIAAKDVLAGMTLKNSTRIRRRPTRKMSHKDQHRRIEQENIWRDRRLDGQRPQGMAPLYEADNEAIHRISRGLTAEMVASVCKLMTNLDLIYAAQKIRVTAHCNTTVGECDIMGTRLQPNHTTDNVEGITASLFEGLSYGCGDVLIGLNPVNDTVSSLAEVLKRFDEVKHQFDIPTQICVLGHITTQIEAVKQRRRVT